MVKCLKPGKVVVILSGKYAGKKAVIVKVNEEGNGKYKFPHALVCGVARPPRKVTRRMNEKKVNKKTTMQVFTKVINLQHFMPTRFEKYRGIRGRYNVEFDFSELPKGDVDPSAKKAALQKIGKMFQQS